MPAGSLTRVQLPTGHDRPGVLTQASVLSMLATVKSTHPVRRGKFVREQLLCLPLPSAPPTVPAPPPEQVGLPVDHSTADRNGTRRRGAHDCLA